MKNLIEKNKGSIISICVIVLFTMCLSLIENKEKTITTSSQVLSTKKIEWGVKRNSNHKQPDLGSTNTRILNSYNGIYMGNSESKKVYLTFDNGYEAGYTKKILEVLKQNNVKATFFITAHYVNTQPELIKRMIDEGHIVGNQFPQS